MLRSWEARNEEAEKFGGGEARKPQLNPLRCSVEI